MSLFRVKFACLIILLSFVSLISFAQNSKNSVNLNWESPKKILDSLGNEINVLSFEEAHYFGKNNYLPAYKISIPGNVTEFKIDNQVYEALTEEELKILSSNPGLISLTPRIETQIYSGKPISVIYIIPLKGGLAGVTDKIISFDYSYSYVPPPTISALPATPKKNAFRLTASSNASVLSSGAWYKISINQSGIFKMDYNFFVSIGINPATIDPRDIKIFGNGGGMLSQKNSDFRYDDLVENSIYVEGEPDGSFDTGDYVLFYGQGPDTWSYNSSKKAFVHTKNIYSDLAYYFITIGPGNGLRVPDQVSISGALQTINTFDERIFLENDYSNILHSGRDWYGDIFDFTLQKSFSFFLPGITTNSYLKLTTSVMGKSFSSSSFTVSLNNQTLGSAIAIPALSTVTYAPKGNSQSRADSINTNLISGSNLNIQLTYNNNGNSSAIGYLNYLDINVSRDLKLYGSETSFRSVASTNKGVSEFSINNPTSSTLIWDITVPVQAKNQLYSLAGSQALFSIATDTLREFISFNKTETFSSPVFVKQILNQNLHGINSPDLPDLIIVTYPDFLNSANRLASFRKTNDNLDVEVITTEQIYNEFSSGAQDISAIRDFVKMLYDRKSGNDSIRYLLLLGDGSYDYKNRISGNTNYVPIYESRQSLHPIDSHSSDDYFGFLDNSEGYWDEDSPDNYLLDIGIGRLPAKNISEADAMINKIIHYGSSLQCQGKWRNKITFIADDGDNNLHLNDANSLANIVNTNEKVYNINKIFLDAYPQISSPGGETCPQAKDAITQAVEKGTFILNYTGHGGEERLAQEGLMDLTQINNWENFNNLTFLITATCEFGRYDDPSVVSGAESTILNSKGGSIALISSTRPVYANTNYNLNKAIYNYMFIPIAGNMPRLGDIIRLTKNNSLSGINNRNYALLGDPSMMLAFPKNEVVVTEINNTPPINDTLKALETVTIEGEIRNEIGTKINDFNGSVYVTVYDKESTLQTIGTQGSSSTTFKILNNLIYEGLATASNGNFTVTFVIPKDISYQFDKGKISLYATKDNSLIDAHGYNIDIIIGGSDTNSAADDTPPKIRLYMNDESFVFGGLTGKNSLFLAKLEDDNGINIAGEGIGHEITAILDNSNDVKILNEYYTAKKDNYKQGAVQFPFKELSSGNHSIKFKCWDTYNNSSESYLEFIVANDAKIALDHVFNYPNPFSTHTTFLFDHNRAGDDLDVMVQVYSVSGKLIKTLDNRFLSSPGHISDIVWDGRDDFGDKIGKGVYIYKVNIRSLRDASNVFKYQKLVILN